MWVVPFQKVEEFWCNMMCVFCWIWGKLLSFFELFIGSDLDENRTSKHKKLKLKGAKPGRANTPKKSKLKKNPKG
jgi:wyosine [tRNA(Phe)-imidazoG37] synthetase (radical SAM superfamily)